MEKVICNNCGWEGTDEDLTLVEFDVNDEDETPTATECKNGFVNQISKSPKDRDFLNGCPNCLTDSYLMDI